MSTDLNDELRQQLQEQLIKSGLMAKLKSEMRVGIVQALDNKAPKSYEKLSKLQQTREGKLVVDIVQEFLMYYGLQNTLQVFNAECSLQDFDPQLKSVIKQEVKIQGESDDALLVHLLKQFEHKRKPTIPDQVPPSVNIGKETFVSIEKLHF